MLKITIPAGELFDERTSEFISIKEQSLQLEHSLVSLSKWEARWKKPFLSKEEKTHHESIDYIKCMTVTQNVKPEAYMFIDNSIIEYVSKYIELPMTATTFHDRDKKTNRDVITAEIIYYWMVTLQIPFECQKWHLNRLFALINVCSIKNQPPKKMGRKATMEQHRSINAARRNRLRNKG